MAKLYSLSIFTDGALTSSSGVVGPVVPGGLVYVVRDLDVVEITGVGSTVLHVLSGIGGRMWQAEGGTTIDTTTFAWRGRQVYAAGEQVGFQVVVGTWAIACSGYQLTSP
jgi:hypothetical protein